jgi:hypothetical protein
MLAGMTMRRFSATASEHQISLSNSAAFCRHADGDSGPRGPPTHRLHRRANGQKGGGDVKHIDLGCRTPLTGLIDMHVHIDGLADIRGLSYVRNCATVQA